MANGDLSRSVERDESRSFRVCYACRVVFLPLPGEKMDHIDCPFQNQGGAKHD